MTFLQKILFPLRCPLCDRVLAAEESCFCNNCNNDRLYVTGNICKRCGKNIDNYEGLCEDCRNSNHCFDGGRVVFNYGYLSGSIYRFKYMNRPAYATCYAEGIYGVLKDWLEALNPDGIIPVPLHKKRLIARGYNQAEELARALSELSGIPLYADCVSRIKNTVPQKEMDRKGRRHNLKKAFIIRENVVKLKTVVLIDDIYTTGSTIDSLTSELKSSGVRFVYFIALSSAGT